MRRLRKIAAVFLFCIGLLNVLNVSAEEQLVYDYADLLTGEEETKLQEYAEDFRDKWDMNVLVVTIDDAEGKSSMEYADDFYDARFPESTQEDGMLYLIDMDHREIYLSSCGEAIRYLTDSRVNAVLDLAYDDVSAGDYYGTFVTFFEECQYYLSQGILQDQYHYDVNTGERDEYVNSYQEPKKITLIEALLAFAAAAAAAAGTVGAVTAKYQLKFEDFHYDPYTNSDVRLSVKQDRLANRFVTHRRIPRNTGSSGGGSGRSTGGSRSSVHRSSSGRSHGGGGRKF